MAQRQSGGACRGGAWGGAIAVNRFIAHAHYAPASTPAHHGASFVNARHYTAALYSIRRLIHWLARDSGPLSRKRALHGAVPFCRWLMRKQRQDHLSARCVSRAAFDAAGRGQNCHPRTRPLPRRRSWHSTGAWISVFSPAGRASAALIKEYL